TRSTAPLGDPAHPRRHTRQAHSRAATATHELHTPASPRAPPTQRRVSLSNRPPRPPAALTHRIRSDGRSLFRLVNRRRADAPFATYPGVRWARGRTL